MEKESGDLVGPWAFALTGILALSLAALLAHLATKQGDGTALGSLKEVLAVLKREMRLRLVRHDGEEIRFADFRDEEDEEEDEDDEFQQDDGDRVDFENMSDREMRKEMRKQRKKEERRLKRQWLEMQNQRRNERDAKRREEQEIAQEKAKAEERLHYQLQEQEQREIDSWKSAISIEHSGSDQKGSVPLEEFLQTFRKRKVVVLEEIAAKLQMRTMDLIERVKMLQEQDLLTGVLDDRGKFIFLSESQLTEIAEFIHRKGRVTNADVARKCNEILAENC